ncbi:MarR-like DNA-binding transcriptional regulator SgrR of sgrS sRNA [Ureibacillus xyleni]|uniref:MarR-like DNA-binding transcriptional regulator SgrR of sgrS sRNA n=1 Tax=Ureibacillus xyleni TaxID=614648 RepID=A0A285RHX6_9BACL|nr:ABC transporter substrate-binding protein [Ureibacillus xyleni]SOB91957.1 MarR-like DNA-binding transcriptional regulator SgrR of sgrS sRNA [Ureibacillus xyleni]
MNLQTQYYFLLLRRVFRDIECNVEISISMKFISQTLFCTERNAKLILNKLLEEGLIQFTSGKGRGNTSTIVFLVSLNKALLKQIQYLIKENKINQAIDLVKEFGKGTEVEEYFINWITNYFGYQKMSSSFNEVEEVEVLRFPIYRPITTVDPTRVFFDFDAHLVKQVYNTLVDYHFDTKEFVGSIAHSWEHNEKCTEWFFYLRKGVHFHNGKELNASSVKDSIIRLFHSPHQWLVEDIADIKVLSKYVVSFSLKRENHLFLHYVAFVPMSIVDVSSTSDGFSQYSIGTGPFRFEKIQPDFCLLSSHSSYFGYRPHLDKVEIIRISEELRGSIEDSKKLFLDTAETNLGEKEQWETSNAIFSGTNVITFNTKRDGPLQKVEIRKLIGELFDRKKLVNLGKPRISPAQGFLIENRQMEHELSYSEKSPTPADIKNKLKKQGYLGEKLTLVTYSRHSLDAKLTQRMLAEAGIRLEIKIVNWNNIQRKEILENADMILFEGTPNEGLISLFELLLFKDGFIYPFLSEQLKSKVESFIYCIKKENNTCNSLKIYKNLEQFLIENGVVHFLVHKQVEVFHDYSLKGVRFNSRMWIDFKDIWYKQ